MWINKLYAAFTFTPQFNSRIEGMYIRDTTSHGDSIGTLRKTSGVATGFEDNDTIGWEIDWFNTLKIYNNLTFQFGAGYLFAGSAMDFSNPFDNTNKSTKDPCAITTNLTYSF